MAIDKIQGPAKSDKMLQIEKTQKNLLSTSIFDVPKTEKDSSTIHSGHFMVSRVHEEKDDDDDEEAPIFSDDSKDFSTSMGYDFVEANKETSQTYSFGPKSTSTLSIDASLTKLFECMTLAYSGKITSPKWKPFRGMHLTVKDKVRLNNIIWREWHMQYIFQKRSVVCQFATPLSDYIHTKPEAVVLEGKYWKRRLDTVTKEYKKWRRYYRDRILLTMPEAPSLFTASRENLSEWELLERVKEVNGMPRNVQQSSTDLALLNADLMDMDFTDNLFSSLNQPFAFPNPRELSQLSCADLIQPGLVQLQPNLEDFMDIDTMQELLAVSTPKPANTGICATGGLSSPAVPDLQPSVDMSQPQLLLQNNNLANTVLGLLDPSILNSGNGNSSTAGINMLTALAALTSSNNGSNSQTAGMMPAPATVTVTPMNTLSPYSSDMIVDDVSPGKQTFPTANQPGGFLGTILDSDTGLKQETVPVQSLTLQNSAIPQQTFALQQTVVSTQALGSPHTFSSPRLIISQQTLGSQQTIAPQPAAVSQQTGRHQQQISAAQPMQTVNLAGLGLTQSPSSVTKPSQIFPPAPSATPAASVLQAMVAQTSPTKPAKVHSSVKASQKTSPAHSAGAGRASSGHASASSKRDNFAVPQGKPVTTPRKPRTIAPAPASPRSSSSSSSSSFLAQLLTKGTYPGAIVNVKKEPATGAVVSLPTTNFTPILPAVPASTTQRIAPSPAAVPSPPTPAFTTTPVSVAATVTLQPAVTADVSGVDFPTSVLLAAASSAIGTTPSNLKDALGISPSSVATASIASATEISNTAVASPSPRSPMQVALSPSPVPSSPLAVVFSEALSPIPSPSSSSMSYQSSPPSLSREDTSGLGVRVGVHTEQRRVAHLSAEQKRRCNLKTGFDLLHTLVPSLAQNPKVSKATMLQKTAEHCRKMKSERAQMQREAAILRQEIESLNASISNVQSQLPETGVPVTRQRKDQMKDMFEEYVKNRTLQNWKFWIFSIIIRSLFDSYNNMVSTANVEELCRTAAAWLDQHCSLVSLRPTVLNALRHLSMSTSILTDPGRMREQATKAVIEGSQGKGGKPGGSTGNP